MRPEGEIRQKIKQAQYRHLKRAMRTFFPADEEWDRTAVQQLKKRFKELFSTAPIHEIAKEFPDVAALLWVLDTEPEPEDSLVTGATLVGSLGGVFLWADTPEQAEQARSILDQLAEQNTGDSKKSWWQGWFK